MGFLAKDSLIGILFSGSRSKCLVQKIEVAGEGIWFSGLTLNTVKTVISILC